MVDINKSVGDNGENKSNDIAIIQLMLRLAKNAKGQSYYTGGYNGIYDQNLKSAIISFQQDQKLIAEKTTATNKGKQGPVAPPVPLLTEKPGLVTPNSKTFSSLNAKLPSNYKDIHIIEGNKTIYIEGKQGDAATAAATIRANANLNKDFREKVAQLVETVYKEHKIVLNVTASGWRRSFAEQADVINKNPSATGAGPGESPHQYGRAVDIGFQRLKWVASDGAIKTDNYWLSSQGMPFAKQSEFWKARDAIAYQQIGLFKTNKKGDIIHVQGFPDNNVSWVRSLAKLLDTVSPVKNHWTTEHHAGKSHYKVDIGLGAELNVGRSIEIWNGKAPVSKAELVKAINAKLAKDPNFSVEKFFGVTPAPAKANKTDARTAAKVTQLKEVDVKAEYITHVQKLLKTDLQAADKNWDKWVPVK